MFKEILNRQKRLLLLVLGGAAFLSGCVRGDRTDCRFPLRLRFSYTNNVPAEELFQEEVASLDLFFYDSQSGLLVHRESLRALLNTAGEVTLPLSVRAAGDDGQDGAEPGEGEDGGENPDDGNDPDGDETLPEGAILEPLSPEYALALPPGRYDVVVWGGVRERYGYASSYVLDEAYVFANRREDTDMKIIEPNCEPLFYGRLRGLDISGDATGEHVVDLTQNTNDIRIVVTGLDEQCRARLETSIIARNGTYSFADNDCMPDGIRTLYIPTENTVMSSAIRDFRILRLWKNDESHLTVRVAPEKTETPENPAGPENPAQRAAADPAKSYTVFDGSLTELLLLYPATDFDRTSDYTIEFRVGSLGDGDDGDVEPDIPADVEVTVLINDWVVIEQNTDLG